MELLFAAIAIPCLAFVLCEYLRGYLKAKEQHKHTMEKWKLREDDREP